MYFNKASSIFKAIEAIAATPSKLEKEALVKEVGSLPLFMRIARGAYDPFVTYGIRYAPKKREGLAPGANSLDEEQFWTILSKLASRELSGTAARDAVQNAVDLLDDASSELFRRIVMKDLRAGFTDGTINRVFPGTLQEFPYMRCSLKPKSNMAKWDWSLGMISQEKADGMFANVNRAGDTVSIHSRQGSPFPTGCMQALEEELIRLLDTDTQTHGELVVYERVLGNPVLLPREIGNGILNSLLAGGVLESKYQVRYMAWDQIPLAAVKPKGKYEVPYKARLTRLIATLRGSEIVTLIPTKIVKTQEDALAHYKWLLAKGREGTVVKHPDTIWKDGTSKDQVKFKLEVDVDLVATAVVPGKAGTKNEGRPGSITCTTLDGLLVVDVTVKNEKMRDAIEADPDSIMQKIFPVRANSVMNPSESSALHSLFLPRFVEDTFRTDKTMPDTLQQVKDQFEAAAA